VGIREFNCYSHADTRTNVSVHFSHACSSRFERDLFSPINFQVEDEMSPVRERYGEPFWRAHHEAWVKVSSISESIARLMGCRSRHSGNWRAKFKAEPQTPARKCSADGAPLVMVLVMV